MSKINVKTAVKKIPVTKNLYGIFLEDINRAVDRGLYPEMIRNRTFEDSIPPTDCTTEDNGYAMVTALGWRDEFNHGEGLTRWIRQNKVEYTEVPAWYCEKAIIELNRKDVLNEYRQTSLAVQFEKGGRIFNTGYDGISLKAGAAYHFYIFAQAEEPNKLIISIKKDEIIYSCTEITVNSSEYIRFNSILTAEADVQNAVLEVCSPEGGSVKLGFVSLMPVEIFMGHGLRKEFVEKLRDRKPGFFRFPGGCIVEGFSPSTAMPRSGMREMSDLFGGSWGMEEAV